MNKDEALKRFVSVLELRNLSKNTIIMYSFFIGRFIDYSSRDNLNDLDLDDALNYIFMMKERGDHPSSINTVICAMRYFYEAVLFKVYTRKQFPNLKYPEKIPYLFDDHQIEELLSKADVRTRLIILLGADCGFRASESAKIRIGDVDVNRRIVHIPYSKRGVSRNVKLSDTLLQTLRDYWKVYGFVNWKKTDYLFPSPKHKGECVTTACIQNWFNSHLKKFDFYEKDMTYHSLRHFFATSMLQKGCDIFLLKKLLGHKSLASTSRYIHYTTIDIENVFSLSDGWNF